MVERSGFLRGALRPLRGNIAVFSLTDLTGNFCRSMVFPYASLYILALGGDATQVGIVNAVAPLAGLLVFPIGGYLADHASRVRLIVLSMVLGGVIGLVFVFAPSWEAIAAAGLLMGFMAIQFPAYSALIADSLEPRERGKGIALMNTITSSLAIFGPYVAGVAIAAYGADHGMRILYAAMAGANFLGAAIQVRLLKEPARATREGVHLSDLPTILRQSYAGIPAMLRRFPVSLRALAGVIVLSFAANAVAGPFWVVYALEQIRLSPVEWGLILLVESAVKLFTFMPAGVLVDRWGRTASLVAALCLSLVALPLFVLATSFVAVLLIRIVAAVAFTIAIPASTALMADLVPRETRGRVMAAIGQGGIMLGSTGGGTGGPAVGYVITVPLIVCSLLGGYLYTLNPAYPWLFVLVTTVLSIVLAALFVRDPGPERAEA